MRTAEDQKSEKGETDGMRGKQAKKAETGTAKPAEQDAGRMRSGRRPHAGLKLLILAVMMLTAAGLLAGCGSDSSGDQVKCLDIVKACSEAASEGTLDEWYSYGEELYDESFDNLYGVQFDMIDDGALLQTASGGVADEVSVLHLKKSSDVSIAKQKLEDRIAERRNEFNGYKPEEVYKLDNARVIVQGNYAALIISDDADNVEAALRSAISGDGEETA